MEKINVLIVEDKQLIAHDIASKLRKHNMEVIGIFDTGEEALQSLEQKVPDLLLMDIQLAGALDGIATAKLITDKYPIPVVYLSDHVDNVTVQRATKTLPAAYLSKPFNEGDVVRAINIAFTNFKEMGKVPHNLLSNHIFIKTDTGHIKLAYDHIIYLEADRAYCKVITEDKTYIHTNSLNHVMEQINHKDFIRVHRSYVINVTKITEIEGNIIKLGKHQVEMSKSMREELIGKLKFLK